MAATAQPQPQSLKQRFWSRQPANVFDPPPPSSSSTSTSTPASGHGQPYIPRHAARDSARKPSSLLSSTRSTTSLSSSSSAAAAPSLRSSLRSVPDGPRHTPACSLAAGSIFTVADDADHDDASEAASRKPSLSHQSLSRHRPCSCALSDAPSAPSLTTYPSYSSTASSAAASQRARRIMSQPKPEKRGLGRAIADYIKPPRD